MRRCKLLSMFLFLAVIILPGILWAELSMFLPEIYEEYSADLGENREKSTISDPSLLLTSGDQLVDFYNDRVPFRSLLIKTEQKVNNALEKHYNEKISPFFYALAGKNTSKDEVGQKEVVDISNVGFLEPDDTSASVSTEPEEIPPEEDDGTVDPDECTHDWNVLSIEEGSCLEDGYVTYICNLCFQEYTENTGKADHVKVVTKQITADYLHYGRTDYICAVCGKMFYENFVSKLVDESYLAPVTLNSSVVLGRFNWLFYNANGKSFDYYKGTNLPSDNELTKYEQALSLLNLACELRGKKLVVLICPNKEAVYSEYLPTLQVSSDVKRVDVIAQYLADNSTVTYLYPLNELKSMDVFYTTYRMYDTHWNQMGAFIATQTLYKTLGIETTDPRNLNVVQTEAYGGDLISMGGLNADNYEADIEYLLNYKTDLYTSYNAAGSDFFNLPVFRTETANAAHSEKLLMIGDSFRTRMIPYLEKDFQHAVFAHRDNVEDVADDFKDADIIILSAVERDESKIIDTALKMAEILSR